MDWTVIGPFATAISTAFVGWQAWETRRSNTITSNHIKNLSHHSEKLNNLNKKKMSIKAIKRFNDKIVPKVYKLNENPTTNDTYKIMINITLSLNAWSVYVTSNVANNNIIKLTLFKIILNWYYNWLNRIIKKIYISHYYDISGLIKALHIFGI